MSTATQRHASPRDFTAPATARRITPSRVDTSQSFTLDQELEQFGSWVDDPLWVPPKDVSSELAQTMLEKSGYFTSEEDRWDSVVEQHRDKFTQVRQINLPRASIRLPEGRFFVSVLPQDRFDEIEEKIPACVQTRLDEFLEGPGKREGVTVSYLKPLCVEVDDELLLTSEEDVLAAIEKIQDEVFEEYRELFLANLPKRLALSAVDASLAIPRRIGKIFAERKQRAVDAFEAQLEFQRRKIALRAANSHRKCRTSGCTFDDMLSLTNPRERDNVEDLFDVKQTMALKNRSQFERIFAKSLPWFVALGISGSYASYAYAATATVGMVVPPLMVCDPAFVAEMPDAPGELLKIGHFDEVGGITHVEI